MKMEIPIDTVLVLAPGTVLTSLDKDLADIGIRVIPRDYVERHKQKALAEVRGDKQALARWTTPIFRSLHALALFPLVDRVDKVHGSGIACGSWLSLVVGGAVLGAGLSFVWPVSLVLVLPFVALVMLAGVTSKLGVDLTIQLWSFWNMNPLEHYGVGPGKMPARYAPLAEQVGTIPGARVFVETLQRDPLLAVVRGYGPFQVRSYIAGWETGDPRLDDFAK